MQWDRFVLIEQIGRGGMGEVWTAYDKENGGTYALKRLLPHLAREKDFKRFKRECEALGLLSSPHLVKMHVISPIPDEPAYAMELCPAGTLKDVYKSKRASRKDAVKIGMHIALGLRSLHTAIPSIVHRDIKPGNVLLGVDGNWKIADLGLCVSNEDTHVTTSNWGSPGFAAPEQYFDFANVDEAADTYALGAVLYNILTGRDCRSLVVLDDKVLGDNLVFLCERLLCHDRSIRLADINVIVRMLEHINLNEDTHSFYSCRKCSGVGLDMMHYEPGYHESYFECLQCGDRFSRHCGDC